MNRKVGAPLLSKDERTKGHTAACILNHGAKQYLFATLFFWRTVGGKRAPIIHWRAKSGRDWTRWQKYSWPQSNPCSPDRNHFNWKKSVLYIEKKTRGCWALLTDTKINQFRIITVILAVNEASNWQNWITLRQWSKNASFYRINCSDSLLSPVSTALFEQNLSKQHPETAAQNTLSSDVFCLWEKSVCAERNMNKTVQYILHMKPHTINHTEKHTCEAHSPLSSRNEETTAALWYVRSCSLVNTHQWYGRTYLHSQYRAPEEDSAGWY